MVQTHFEQALAVLNPRLINFPWCLAHLEQFQMVLYPPLSNFPWCITHLEQLPIVHNTPSDDAQPSFEHTMNRNLISQAFLMLNRKLSKIPLSHRMFAQDFKRVNSIPSKIPWSSHNIGQKFRRTRIFEHIFMKLIPSLSKVPWCPTYMDMIPECSTLLCARFLKVHTSSYFLLWC